MTIAASRLIKVKVILLGGDAVPRFIKKRFIKKFIKKKKKEK